MRDLLNETTVRDRNINEAYDDLPLDYFLQQAKKLKDYSGFDDKMKKNGFVFLHFSKNDDWNLYGEIKVFNEADGSEIANATYGKQHEFNDLKGSMDVRSDFRRNKIATMMYDWIESLNKEELKPDLPHSSNAAHFWKSRLKKK